ncbi:MAG: M56 family metallopeptidase, partial [Myxococcota bacterium]
MSLSLALQAAAVYAVALGLGHTGSPAHRRTVLIAASVAVAALPLLGWVPLAQPPLPEAFFGALEVVQEPSGMGVSNSSPPSTGTSWCLTLGHVWAIGLAMAVGRLGLDLLAVQRLWASARDLSGDVGFSDGVDTPMVVGVLRPRILLPTAAAEWSASRRTLVLAHERAHLDGHDNLWRLVSRAVACLHWFDPLAWLTLRALRDASEQHVDEQVLKRGFEATDYAEALIALARARPAALAMTMARTSGLERRVRAVLGPRRRPWPGAPWLGAGLVAAVACGSATTPARPDLPPPATETSSAWQTAIDHEAQRLMERYAAQGVAIVVLDAVSGEELAYADHGDLLSQLVNPGSVVKPFV